MTGGTAAGYLLGLKRHLTLTYRSEVDGVELFMSGPELVTCVLINDGGWAKS